MSKHSKEFNAAPVIMAGLIYSVIIAIAVERRVFVVAALLFCHGLTLLLVQIACLIVRHGRERE